jgi:chromosome segregation ATPase
MDERERHHINAIRELEEQLCPIEREAERLRGLIKQYKKELASIRGSIRAQAKYAANRPDHVKAKKAEMQKRLEEGPAMREAGLTYADIGAAWGIGADRAREIVKRAERIKAFREHHGPSEAP